MVFDFLTFFVEGGLGGEPRGGGAYDKPEFFRDRAEILGNLYLNSSLEAHLMKLWHASCSFGCLTAKIAHDPSIVRQVNALWVSTSLGLLATQARFSRYLAFYWLWNEPAYEEPASSACAPVSQTTNQPSFLSSSLKRPFQPAQTLRSVTCMPAPAPSGPKYLVSIGSMLSKPTI